jgi:hypothetical protein
MKKTEKAEKSKPPLNREEPDIMTTNLAPLTYRQDQEELKQGEAKTSARNDNWPLSWQGPGLGIFTYFDEPYEE